MKARLPADVWITDTEVLILGTPASECSETIGEEEHALHNCDAMGCGCAHVLYRAPVTASLKRSALEYGEPKTDAMCACGWSGLIKDMPANPSGSRVCPACGASGGLIFRVAEFVKKQGAP